MRLPDQIACVFGDAAAAADEPYRWESALLHACIAIDTTAKRIYPTIKRVGDRFTRCIRDYYWLVSSMMSLHVDLGRTTFANLGILSLRQVPDFADVIYHVHRCIQAHGGETPDGFVTIIKGHPEIAAWSIGKDRLQFSERLVWVLAAITIFSEVNRCHLGECSSLRFEWGLKRMNVSDCWGLEDSLRPIAKRFNLPQ